MLLPQDIDKARHMFRKYNISLVSFVLILRLYLLVELIMSPQPSQLKDLSCKENNSKLLFLYKHKGSCAKQIQQHVPRNPYYTQHYNTKAKVVFRRKTCKHLRKLKCKGRILVVENHTPISLAYHNSFPLTKRVKKYKN